MPARSDRHLTRTLIAKRGLSRARTRRGSSRGSIFAIVALGLVSLALIGATASVGAVFAVYTHYAEDYVPIEQRLQARSAGLTEVYDRGGPVGGVLLGHLDNPNGALQDPVPLVEISQFMIDATVSTEDNSFWTNPGVNPRGLLRAAWENYTGGGIGSGTGGSSITQQLIKNVYLSDDCTIDDRGIPVCVAKRNLDRKLREISYALELENDYTKEQVLGWYLNQISYADRYVGVEAAAQGYFHRTAAELTLAQAALLAGIPSSPTDYHPRLNCAKDDAGVCITNPDGTFTVVSQAKQRQEDVLRLMVTHGRATQEAVDAALAEPLLVYPNKVDTLAPAWIDNQVEPRLVRMCEAGILPKIQGTKDCYESVHSAGYRVTSTLNWAETTRAQNLIQSAIATGLANNCACHNAAIATIDPRTGQVVVYAPNIDKDNSADRKVAGEIDQLNEVNQPGSSFKPMVYLAWFESQQKTPMSVLWDTSPMPLDNNDKIKDIDDDVVITNPRPGGGGEGLITARAALGGSQNIGAFRAATEATPTNVIEMAKRMGITTLEQGFDPTFRDHSSVYYGPSVATGGANIRAIDMAYMNATIANMGLMVGVPSLAKTLDLKSVKSLSQVEGEEYSETFQEYLDFTRGNLRLPGTRNLDPVTVLKVQTLDGEVLYEHGSDLKTEQVVDGAYVWMLHSIMSDCTARFIIWNCGSSNDDLALDSFADGVKIPTGIKTGTQQGYASANDTLETWMNGYSRYAGTSLWVGNADNQLVHDGPTYSYAAANTTVRLFKTWMGQYHHDVKEVEGFTTFATFDDRQPANVKLGNFNSATTEKGMRGGCFQVVQTWMKTDIKYPGDCMGGRGVPLPAFKPDLAIKLARQRGISYTTSSGQVIAEDNTPPPVIVRPTTPSSSVTASPSSGPAVTPTPGGGRQTPVPPTPKPATQEPTSGPLPPTPQLQTPVPGPGRR
ncbi:hypothetical protein AYO38_01030 [bacterium SCGC AG-212-C10]|nr:hypothetical protein AYO38_01030 [bacterium SCGC AG-212-C10]